MEPFYYLLSDESDQGASTTETHLRNILRFFLTTGLIAPFLTTMLDHMYGCAKHYRCAYAIYLLTCIAL